MACFYSFIFLLLSWVMLVFFWAGWGLTRDYFYTVLVASYVTLVSWSRHGWMCSCTILHYDSHYSPETSPYKNCFADCLLYLVFTGDVKGKVPILLFSLIGLVYRNNTFKCSTTACLRNMCVSWRFSLINLFINKK